MTQFYPDSKWTIFGLTWHPCRCVLCKKCVNRGASGAVAVSTRHLGATAEFLHNLTQRATPAETTAKFSLELIQFLKSYLQTLQISTQTKHC